MTGASFHLSRPDACAPSPLSERAHRPVVPVRCLACHSRHDAPNYDAAAFWLRSHTCNPRSFR